VATILKSQLVFTNIGAGLQSTQPHGLNVQGLELIPDHLHFDNADFGFVAATTTTVTVINNGVAPGTCRVLCELWHTFERPFGVPLTEYVVQLPNPPFVSLGGGGGGGGGGSVSQAFTYTCTGAEGSDFFISLPVAQANDNYIPTALCGGVEQIFTVDLPDLVAGDRTTTQFRVITSADVRLNDRIDVLIVPRT
jgi:hypothetical protein